MECQDVRLLLAFSERRAEAMDAAERDAIARHVSGCPDCAAFAQAEHAADEALSQAMRDVPVPAELKAKLLRRLAERTPGRRWPWLAAAAAMLVVAGTLTLGYSHWSRPVVTIDDITELASRGMWGKDKVEQFFADQGLDAELPSELDFQYLQAADVTFFKGRRVARLTFSRLDDRSATAIVLILPRRHFRVEAPEVNIHGLAVWHHDDFVYIIECRGPLQNLRLPPA